MQFIAISSRLKTLVIREVSIYVGKGREQGAEAWIEEGPGGVLAVARFHTPDQTPLDPLFI